MAWALLYDRGVVLSWSLVEMLPLADLVHMLRDFNELDNLKVFRTKQKLHGITYHTHLNGTPSAVGLKDSTQAL